MSDPKPFIWIAIVGGFVSFLSGAGLGMNDLANSFGTTYGARILTLTQIVILASICEFAGSISLGGAVTSTISSGIAKPSDFADHPYVFMYGMLCACGSAFCWLAIATWLILPVSSTHSICGGVIGFALVYGGGDSVIWAGKKDDFPFVSGVVPIIASWFISPVLTGIVSGIIYGLVKLLVLRPKNSVVRATYSLPIVVGIAFFLESFFILYKGASKKLNWSVNKAAWVGAIIGGGAGLVSCAFIPILRRRIRTLEARMEEDRELAPFLAQVIAREKGEDSVDAVEVLELSETEQRRRREDEARHHQPTEEDIARKEGEQPMATGNVVRDGGNEDSDTHSDQESEPSVEQRHESGSRIFDSRAEYVYRYLQIFTAICASFAHGASDVSNAIGPFAAIYEVYQKGAVSSKSETPIWILALGGAGLIIGIATFGVRLMRLLGEKITLITPSRGFSAELAAALVVSIASGYGIPVSSTHCITGAVIAISMVDVGFCKVKWLMVLKMYGGWVFTLVVTAVMSATFFAQGVNSPIRL